MHDVVVIGAGQAGLSAIEFVQERVRAGLPPASVVRVFDRIVTDGIRWSDGSSDRVDVILWATAERDPCVQLVGYGPSVTPSAATAPGWAAAFAVRRHLVGHDGRLSSATSIPRESAAAG